MDSLCEEMNVFYKSLDEYVNNKESDRNEKLIKALLSRKSPFAAFKREYIRSHSDQYPELVEECL